MLIPPPRDMTIEQARLERVNAYVRSDEVRLAWREGRDSHGEVLKRLAERVVL
jgi:hypothetical protein